MKWLELLNMEYGECVVLGGGDRSLLMVDCGSVSQKLREGDVPLDAWLETIAARYEPAMERWFLLTHFHRDHLSGFQKLLESPGGVLLPGVPAPDAGGQPRRPPAAGVRPVRLPVRPAPKRRLPGEHLCVKAFRTLEQRLGQDRIFTLGAGDSFHFDGVEYQVLWPRVENYPFEPELAAAGGGAQRAVRVPLPAGVRQAVLREERGVPRPVRQVRGGLCRPLPGAAGKAPGPIWST